MVRKTGNAVNSGCQGYLWCSRADQMGGVGARQTSQSLKLAHKPTEHYVASSL
jgi:hypothetical protein